VSTSVLTIGAMNCVAVLGCSWPTARRYARAHGVPELRITPRRVVLPAGPLLAALTREQVSAPLSEAAELDAARRALAAELAR
jgi:hypothetical protein